MALADEGKADTLLWAANISVDLATTFPNVMASIDAPTFTLPEGNELTCIDHGKPHDSRCDLLAHLRNEVVHVRIERQDVTASRANDPPADSVDHALAHEDISVVET